MLQLLASFVVLKKPTKEKKVSKKRSLKKEIRFQPNELIIFIPPKKFKVAALKKQQRLHIEKNGEGPFLVIYCGKKKVIAKAHAPSKTKTITLNKGWFMPYKK